MNSNSSNIVDRLTAEGTSCIFPMVSVVITNYNYASYIEDCLSSIASQKYRNFECIIVDDDSTDNSIDVINKYIEGSQAKDRFRLITHERNLGQLSAFKTGFEAAAGVFVVFVDADDILMNDFISEHVNVSLNNPPVAFTCSRAYGITVKKEMTGFVRLGSFRKQNMFVPPQPFYTLQWPWSCTSSMMFRRAVLEYVFAGGAEGYRYCADLFICNFANVIGGSILMPEAYTAYRIHHSNQFQSNQIIGSNGNIGDMRKHPEHKKLLNDIRRVLIANEERLIALMGEKNYTITIARVTAIGYIGTTYSQIKKDTNIRLVLRLYLVFKILKMNLRYFITRYFLPGRLPLLRDHG